MNRCTIRIVQDGGKWLTKCWDIVKCSLHSWKHFKHLQGEQLHIYHPKTSSYCVNSSLRTSSMTGACLQGASSRDNILTSYKQYCFSHNPPGYISNANGTQTRVLIQRYQSIGNKRYQDCRVPYQRYTKMTRNRGHTQSSRSFSAHVSKHRH